jgi:hypothetical protein
MGNLNYINGDEDAPGNSGTFWMVEADRYGQIRLQLYDLVNRRFFEQNEYFLSDITNHSTNAYTWPNLKSLDTAPSFPANAEAALVSGDDGVTLTFPDARGYWPAENYKITVTKGLKTVWTDTVISNYVRTVSDGMQVPLGELESGTYTVRITPFSPYAKGGRTLKATLSV